MNSKTTKTAELLKQISELPTRVTKIKSIPNDISPKTIEDIDRWVRSNDDIPKSIDENNRTEVCIGFDFGTSSTKVIVRLPYLENKTSAFPVPSEFQMDDHHPHLWKTLIYFNEDTSEFSLYPKNKGFVELPNIKTRLMDIKTHEEDMAKCNKTNDCVRIEDITTAYFALMLRLIRGWTFSEAFKPENTLSSNSILDTISKWFSNQKTVIENYEINKPYWNLHVGLPAENVDSKLNETYEKIINKAWTLCFSNKDVTLENIRNEKPRTCKELDKDFNVTITIVPEVGAEIMGLLKQGKHEVGQYLIVDVGASTLDVCFIDYNKTIQKSGVFPMDKCSVSLLGAELEKWCLNLENFSDDDLIEAIRYSIARVVADVKKDFRHQSTYHIWETEKLPLIICGGGSNNSLHQKAIKEAEISIGKDLVKKGIERIKYEKPNEIKTNANSDNFHRLSVAWGLSYENAALKLFYTPSEQQPVKLKKINWEDNINQYDK